MKHNIFCHLSLALVLAGCAASAGLDGVAQKELPPGTVLACSQHVDDFGGEGRAPTSIRWQSYSSSQDLTSIIRFYSKQLGNAPMQDKLGGYSWPLADGLHYSVYTAEQGRHWLDCDWTRQISMAVVLISKLTSSTKR